MDIRAQEFYANIANMYASTPLRPLALAVTLCMGVALLMLPRKYAVIPIIIVMLSITELQRVVVFSFNFSMVRILEVFGWARVLLRAETRGFERTGVDAIVPLYAVSLLVLHTIQRHSLQALITALGITFDVVGLYFLFRILIVDFEGAYIVARTFALCAVPIAVLMIVEQRTGRNLFFVFGGVPEYTYIRGGLLRSQAAFQHPILAGTFGATLLPLVVGLWRVGTRDRWRVVLGVLSALVISVTSSSSGPVFALMMGAAAMFLWPAAESLRVIRWCGLLAVVGLQLVMKSPIYALFARFPLFSGSTGYYRYVLMDAFFSHFRDWAAVGVPSTAYWGQGLFDVTNQYIRVAVDGGLLTLLLFILMFVTAYRELGLALRVARREEARAEAFFLWGMGCTLFAHLVSFISVSYFDQIIVLWYILLAMISGLSRLVTAPEVLNADPIPVPQ